MAVQTTENPPDQLEISCQSCGSSLVVEAHMRTAQCPWCASTSIVERPPTPDRPMPAFVVSFVIPQEKAATLVQQWIRSRSLFARSDFKRAAAELTRGVYLPAYLYSAVADTQYSAQIGENYTTTETYTTTDSNGKTQIRTRTVTKTEWRPLYGQHAGYLLDILVSASRGVANERLEAIEPFDLRALRRYTPWLISGWLAEDPSMTQEQCHELARNEGMVKVEHLLQNFMPGDSYTDLKYETQFRNEDVDLTLLPVWSFAIRYHADRPPVQVLVNGQTGRVGGNVPFSATKITSAVLLVLAAIAVLVLLFR